MSTGRRDKYSTIIEPNFQVILGWLRSAYTEQSIAKRLGIGNSTWHRHKAAHADFQELVDKGRQDIGALAVNNLVRRANGYEYDEIHVEERNRDGITTTVVKKVTCHVPPDVAANCVILFNRMATKWKNTQHIQHAGEIKQSGVLLTPTPISREEWPDFYNKVVKPLNGNGSGNGNGNGEKDDRGAEDTAAPRSSGPLSPEANRRF